MKRVKRNSHKSMRKTASQLRNSRSMHRTFTNDLRLIAYKKTIQTATFRSFQAETTQEKKEVGGDAVHRRPCLHLVRREDLGGSYQHAE